MPATRKQRLQETLRAELSDIIRREMRDPRFSVGLLSITDVEVSQDLKHAIVFVSVLGDEKVRKDELTALRGASGFLRGELGKRKVFINVPDLSFKYDEAMERGTHMFELLERVKREDAERIAQMPQETAGDNESTE
jgi:ribosome-binding factor A